MSDPFTDGEPERIPFGGTCCTTCMALINRVIRATFVVWDKHGAGWFECEVCLANPDRERAGGTKPVAFKRISMFRLRIARDENDKKKAFLEGCDNALDLALREASGDQR